MATIAQPSAACNEDRISLLHWYKSSVLQVHLVEWEKAYDIPNAFTLPVPVFDRAIYHHGGELVLMYWHHLEFSLCLPLYPFSAGVSSAQNIVGAVEVQLDGFLSCLPHHLPPGECRADPRDSGSLIVAKTSKGEGHIYLQSVDSFWLVSNILDTNKGWKEKFFFLFGSDSILACHTWSEIKNECLRVVKLSEVEKQGLVKI